MKINQPVRALKSPVNLLQVKAWKLGFASGLVCSMLPPVKPEKKKKQ